MRENNEQEMAIGVRVYDFMENTDHKEIPKQQTQARIEKVQNGAALKRKSRT